MRQQVGDKAVEGLVGPVGQAVVVTREQGDARVAPRGG